jgi:SAM-dependent methyltransferase
MLTPQNVAYSKHAYPKNPSLNMPPKCPICSGDFSYFTSFHDALFGVVKGEFDLYRCGSCKYIKILPEPVLNEIKSFYPEYYYSHQDTESSEESRSFAYKFYGKLQDAILDRWYKRKPRVGFFLSKISWLFKNSLLCVPLEKSKGGGLFLDIGSGSGYWVEKLSKYGWDCKGIDIIGKESENNIIGDFLQVPFEKKFEYIRIHGVIEHVIDPEKYIERVSELLEKNGEFHISTPNSNSLSFKIFKKYWVGLEVPRHIQVFNDQNLTQLLKKHGLEVIKTTSELSSGGFIACMYIYLRSKFKISMVNSTLFFFLTVIFLPLDFLLQWSNQGLNMVVVARK